MSIPFNSVDALSWWIKNQGQPFYLVEVRQGDVVIEDTASCKKIIGDGIFKVTKWIADGISQPTDAEIEAIVSDYERWKVIDAEEKAAKKTALLSKLNISVDDLKLLLE